jgi:hypothetical protein
MKKTAKQLKSLVEGGSDLGKVSSGYRDATRNCTILTERANINSAKAHEYELASKDIRGLIFDPYASWARDCHTIAKLHRNHAASIQKIADAYRDQLFHGVTRDHMIGSLCCVRDGCGGENMPTARDARELVGFILDRFGDGSRTVGKLPAPYFARIFDVCDYVRWECKGIVELSTYSPMPLNIEDDATAGL